MQVLTMGVLALALSSGAAMAKDREIARIPQLWRQCSQDADCIVAEDLCPGSYWTINKRYAWRNAKTNERMRSMIKCAVTVRPPPAGADCLGGVCVPLATATTYGTAPSDGVTGNKPEQDNTK